MPYKDPEQRRIYVHGHYVRNRASYIARASQWAKDHPAEKAQAARKASQRYRKNHPEKTATDNRQYKQDHPEQMIEHDKRKRARRRNAAINDFTHAQWLELQAAYDHCCAYCGKRAKGHLTQDHITPLIQGGNHTLANIVPACRHCNNHKHTGSPLQQVQPLLITIAPAKPLRKRKRKA